MSPKSKDEEISYWLQKGYYDCVPYLPPARLDISITTACNVCCAYCWQQEKKGSSLTFNTVARVIDDICSLKPPKLNLTGGEPTIWPGFERLLGHAKKAGINSILLCTNGLRLRDYSFAEGIITLGVTALNISVDTLNPEKFKMLRGFDFSIFKEISANASMLKEKFPGLCVTLASVMSKAVTPEELFEVKEYAHSHGFGYFIQTFDNTAYPAINRKFALSAKERNLYNRELSWLKGTVGAVVRRNRNPFTDRKRSAHCYKGITTVKLSSDGSVSFCWNTRTIGNILQKPFFDIWNSREAQELRKDIRDKKCNCHFDCDVYESLELYE